MPENDAHKDSVDVRILIAPLLLGKLHWTSEELAKYLGLSQSKISRTWRKYFTPSKIGKGLPRDIEISEVHIVSGNTYLICNEVKGPSAVGKDDWPLAMRSPRRFPLQSILAAQKLAELNQAKKDGHFVIDSVPSSEIFTVITTDKNYESEDCSVVFIESNDWQGLLPYLLNSSHHTSAANLKELQQKLFLWATSPRKSFKWRSNPKTVPASLKPIRPLSVKSTQQVIADQIFDAIVNRIWSGSLTAGDRVTEASLARQLHTTRNQTRDAIRALISIGLIDQHKFSGGSVPAPSLNDILDVYSARKALGIEIIKRAISNDQLNVSELKGALQDLITTAKTENSYETGNVDLRLQDVIAANSGMRNIPQMFSTLAKQLRIYIAVMGITYVYSIDEMVRDDTLIIEHVIKRDLDSAIAAWESKVSNSLTFMSNHVANLHKR
jgi:DNA-binding GntR family transcriptional regulator